MEVGVHIVGGDLPNVLQCGRPNRAVGARPKPWVTGRDTMVPKILGFFIQIDRGCDA
jgi:hypothetical protein